MSISKLLLLEFQSKNYLYHFTNIKNIINILSDNKLDASGSFSTTTLGLQQLNKGYEVEGVSLTRNRQLTNQGGHYIAGGFRYPVGIVFDRNKLKSKYKLYPFDVHGWMNKNRNATLKDRLLDEEIVIGDIDNVMSFIEFIYIPRKWIEDQGRGTDKNVYLEGIIDMIKFLSGKIEVKYFDRGNFKDLELPSPDESYKAWMNSLNKQLFK